MQTIIIATDFSESSAHAARYAAALSCALGVKNMILYHSYDQAPRATDVPLPEPHETTFAYEGSLAALEILEAQIKPLKVEDTTIELVADELPLIMGVSKLAEQRNAVLVVVGMTGKSRMEKILVGSNTVALAEACPVPLLIVPDKVDYSKPIDRAIFACDLRDVAKNLPVDVIDEFVTKLDLDLLVLNVEDDRLTLLGDIVPEQFKLHQKLDHLNPQYHYIKHKEVTEGILEFAGTHQAGLIITVPKRHNFFDSLFHRSVTKKLAHHTHVPLLLLRKD